MFRKKQLALLLSLSLLTLPSFAAPATQTRMVVAPQCLIKNDFKTIATHQSFALLAVDEKGIEKLIAAKAHHTKTPCGGFVDVTTDWEQFKSLSPHKAEAFLKDYLKPTTSISEEPKSYSIKYETQVNALLATMNSQDMWTDLTTLTAFPDRYSRSDNGVKAAEWIKGQIEALAKANNRTDVNVYFVKTEGYKQPSVVARFGDSEEPGVVIGGHMDTTTSWFENRPGADDDGSGSVTVMEVARTLLSSGMHFKKPIYFIWYAAEEVGLVGSQNVVKDFKKKLIPIDAVIQFDMTGYANKADPTMWLINDYVNKDLTDYVATLIKTYVKEPINYTKCGYACSDHATWHKGGFAAAMPFEASFGTDNPDIHSANDVMSNLSLKHMEDFAKLGTAFAVEMAEPAA